MKIQFKKSSSLSQSQCLVVFTAQSSTTAGKTAAGKKTQIHTKNLGKEISHILSEAHEEETLAGEQKEIRLFRNTNIGGSRHLMSVGLGDVKKMTLENLRQSMARALESIKTHGFKDIRVDIDSATTIFQPSQNVAYAITEGLALGHYSFDIYKNTPALKKREKGEISFTLFDRKGATATRKSIESAKIVCEAVNFARTLADTPGNLMTPKVLAEAAQEAAKGTALKVTAWDKAQIKREKMGGLYGVSLGSAIEPRFILMEYKGAAASKKPICLVGKGLTFDSGGISLKPPLNMHEMKYDMCGGANVIAAMVAIAKLKMKVNATAYIPASENMPGPLANKPGDILKARNGKTVEILNTDAEGRVILMDALSYASEKKPAAIVTAATLTGAIVVALGNVHTGVFTKNQPLLKKIQEASDQTGERVWHMPLCEDYVNDMKGTHADLTNIAPGRGAGSATAAAFLEQFVDEGIPWAHFDIAGTAWNLNHRINYHPKKGASGCMVRTFVELAKMF